MMIGNGKMIGMTIGTMIGAGKMAVIVKSQI